MNRAETRTTVMTNDPWSDDPERMRQRIRSTVEAMAREHLRREEEARRAPADAARRVRFDLD